MAEKSMRDRHALSLLRDRLRDLDRRIRFIEYLYGKRKRP